MPDATALGHGFEELHDRLLLSLRRPRSAPASPRAHRGQVERRRARPLLAARVRPSAEQLADRARGAGANRAMERGHPALVERVRTRARLDQAGHGLGLCARVPRSQRGPTVGRVVKRLRPATVPRRNVGAPGPEAHRRVPPVSGGGGVERGVALVEIVLDVFDVVGRRRRARRPGRERLERQARVALQQGGDHLLLVGGDGAHERDEDVIVVGFGRKSPSHTIRSLSPSAGRVALASALSRCSLQGSHNRARKPAKRAKLEVATRANVFAGAGTPGVRLAGRGASGDRSRALGARHRSADTRSHRGRRDGRAKSELVRPEHATASTAVALAPVGRVPVVRALFSNIERSDGSVMAETMKVEAIFGNVELDLRETRFAAGVTELRVKAVFGSVEIVVPADVAVEVHGSAVFGNFEGTTRTTADPDAPALRVVGSATFASVAVKTVPPLRVRHPAPPLRPRRLLPRERSPRGGRRASRDSTGSAVETSRAPHGRRGAMTTSAAVADVENKTVSFEGTTDTIQALGEDTFTVLVKGVPVGRIVYTFGAANGVAEGDAVSEDTMYAIAEAWFAATAD